MHALNDKCATNWSRLQLTTRTDQDSCCANSFDWTALQPATLTSIEREHAEWVAINQYNNLRLQCLNSSMCWMETQTILLNNCLSGCESVSMYHNKYTGDTEFCTETSSLLCVTNFKWSRLRQRITAMLMEEHRKCVHQVMHVLDLPMATDKCRGTITI